jgi:HlyD family secretion protein
VSQIRLQPQVVSNVTTYNTIVDVPNQELKLKPGMTADVKIEIARRDDVLRVPNAALRFKPTAEIFAMLGQTPPPAAGNGRGNGGANAPVDRARYNASPGAAGVRNAVQRPGPGGSGTTSQVWIQEQGQLHAVPVTLGLADTQYTEVISADPDLAPGTEVVTSVTGDADARTPAATNPLVASPRGGRGR